MKRLLVNDCLTCIPGTKTFWNDLQEWFAMDFFEDDYSTLMETIEKEILLQDSYGLIVRNASYFGPLPSSKTIPTVSILQDIMEDGPGREMQISVIDSSKRVVYNSEFTRYNYIEDGDPNKELQHSTVIPLPVDFSLFEPGNAMGLQQALSLPDGCVCWIGAHEGAAGQIKGYDVFLQIVRTNPDISFVAVFKDSIPVTLPPNMRAYARVTHEELVKIIGACKVGLCTSRTETQHLAGIEMGACGLPMVAPPVGCYWKRKEWPGTLVVYEDSPEIYANVIRTTLSNPGDPQQARAYWKKEFDVPVIKAAWTKLVEEVECSGAS